MATRPAVTENPGGWYEIDGMESWHGTDHHGYLRTLIRNSPVPSTVERARAVLAYVERDTPWFTRVWREWRANR